MPTAEALKQSIDQLVKDGVDLILVLRHPDKAKAKGVNFEFDYQAWYSRSLPVVRTLAPDRYEEFRRYYEPDPKRKNVDYETYVIQDHFKNLTLNEFHYPRFDARQHVENRFLSQIAILKSVASRLDDVLANIEGALFADLKDAELSVASALLKTSPRAAGALAGVILESHLQRISKFRGITFRKKSPTIADLNDALKNAGVYETAVWRKISYLGDVRNLCSHKKTVDPTPDQVVELISGVEWALKTIA